MQRSARLWTSLVYLCVDPWVVLVVAIPLVVGLSVAAGLAVTVVGGAAALALSLVLARSSAGLERRWAGELLALGPLAAPPRRVGPHRFGAIGRVLTDLPAWKALAYWLIKAVVAPVQAAVVLGLWCGAAALLTLPLYLRWLPQDTAHLLLADVSSARGQAFAACFGLLAAVLAVGATVLAAGIDAALVRSLLAASRVRELEARLDVAASRRDAAVEAAEAERRRIERDLHDGAQQRLVSLAMSLGMAKEKFDGDPDAARALLDEAHGEAKAAMTELRNIARGIHPAVLSDRGLDAALSGLVARSPVPVALRIALGDERLPDAVEGAAYFVVAEALTNVAKHAQAGRATVNLVRSGDRVVIEIGDDGQGGAALRGGGGLAGLRDRVSSLGGFLHVSSPSGGPTSVVVELPCAS